METIITANEALAMFSFLTFVCFAVLFLTVAVVDSAKSMYFLAGCLFLALVSGAADGISGHGPKSILFEVSLITAMLSLDFMRRGLQHLGNAKSIFKQSTMYMIYTAAYVLHVVLLFQSGPWWVQVLPVNLAVVGGYFVSSHLVLTFVTRQKTLRFMSAAWLAIGGINIAFYPSMRTHESPVYAMISTMITQFGAVFFLSFYYSIKNERIEEAKNTANTYIHESPIGMLIVGEKLKIVKANPAMEQSLGFSERELVSKNLTDIFSDVSRVNFDEFMESLENGRVLRELVLSGRDGNYVPHRVVGTKQGDGNYILFCDDLSEEKLAQRTQNEMQQLVFQSSKMASLGELAASVAHEINTPLAVVRSAAEMAAKAMGENSNDTSAVQSSISHIRTGGERIESIVRSLMSLARQNQNTAVTVDLRDCIKDTLAFLKVLLSKHQIRVELQLADEPLNVQVRPDDVNQIFTNLIINARDAVERSDKKLIIVSCRKEFGKVILSVQDSGCGMMPEVSSRVFENFFSTKEAGRGTGLGLSLSRKMAMDNGGNLTFTTAFEQGSTFTLSLPLVNASTIQPEPTQHAADQGQKRILVVDDEPSLLQVVQEFLVSEGYHTTSASTLAEARNKIANNNYDYVFTDYLLDSGTGEDVLKECRQRYSRESCRVFLLTGYDRNEKIDVDGHLKKPFRLDDLRKALQDHV